MPSTLNEHDLEFYSDILVRHRWDTLDQWVETLDHLADLTDEDIDEILRSAQG